MKRIKYTERKFTAATSFHSNKILKCPPVVLSDLKSLASLKNCC